MTIRLLTRTEGIAIAMICLVFGLAGVWAFWAIHPALAIGLTTFLAWMLTIYHSKVCLTCPHTHCPGNPRFWNREHLTDIETKSK